MDEEALKKYREMVIAYQKRDDPTGWFENIYSQAKGDHTAVFWADLEPNPYMLDWLNHYAGAFTSKRAIAIGCGGGDDAEALADKGFQVTAFDISVSAIDLCLQRYPNSMVNYVQADLFDYPKSWLEAFDLIYECNTIQVLPGKYRIHAREAIASLVKEGGNILVSCRSRNKGEQENDIPLPLDRHEIDGFKRSGCVEKIFIAYDDEQQPPMPHFFAVYSKGHKDQFKA